LEFYGRRGRRWPSAAARPVMRVVVVGASGNVGSALVRALSADDSIDEITGVARRVPGLELPKLSWVGADVVSSDLEPIFSGADAVVHLAWAIQPNRDEAALERINLTGSERVFEAVRRAEVPALVHASSVGAYSAAPKDRLLDESWPVEGIPSSAYSRHKAALERRLDSFATESPSTRIVRMRPGLIFQRGAASEIRRLFIGPFLPNFMVRRELLPVVPKLERLRFQAVHADDVAEAYRLAITSDAEGAFNVAADPVLDSAELARLLGAREVPVGARTIRRAAELSWKLRLQASDPGWVDLALGAPLMDVGRAKAQLGWAPVQSSGEALVELMDGLRRGEGLPTPTLRPGAGGRFRLGELRSGLGARQ
jgi:UDP-glucose 4-epimerase